MLDGSVKTMYVDDSHTVSQLMITICSKIGKIDICSRIFKIGMCIMIGMCSKIGMSPYV